MAISCKLGFVRFSAELKFQDRSECGNIWGVQSHFGHDLGGVSKTIFCGLGEVTINMEFDMPLAAGAPAFVRACGRLVRSCMATTTVVQNRDGAPGSSTAVLPLVAAGAASTAVRQHMDRPEAEIQLGVVWAFNFLQLARLFFVCGTTST